MSLNVQVSSPIDDRCKVVNAALPLLAASYKLNVKRFTFERISFQLIAEIFEISRAGTVAKSFGSAY
jgi:hypothetical protein